MCGPAGKYVVGQIQEASTGLKGEGGGVGLDQEVLCGIFDPDTPSTGDVPQPPIGLPNPPASKRKQQTVILNYGAGPNRFLLQGRIRGGVRRRSPHVVLEPDLENKT